MGEDKHKEEVEAAKQEMRELEQADEVPKDLEDWPDGKAKYETFGGPDGESGYEDVADKLGPADVRHHEDGEVSVAGEKVDNPEDFKGDPIPGGPTDPEAPDDIGVTKTSMERNEDDDGDREEAHASVDGDGNARDE